VSVRWPRLVTLSCVGTIEVALSPNAGGTMSEALAQDEPEEDQSPPAPDEPERMSNVAVPELDDDWED
jgi:hypothetical protein